MVVWDKDNSGNFADCELAWTSFKTATRLFKYRWNGMLQSGEEVKTIFVIDYENNTLVEYDKKN